MCVCVCVCVYYLKSFSYSHVTGYGRGTIFVVADPGSYSPYSTSPPSGYSVAPPTNLPLHHSTNESHAPITATSGSERAANYVVPNQNLVLANSPNNDNMRKVLTQADDTPTQALISYQSLLLRQLTSFQSSSISGLHVPFLWRQLFMKIY